jgi:cytochrome bd-type quinol oxidase subunit 1
MRFDVATAYHVGFVLLTIGLSLVLAIGLAVLVMTLLAVLIRPLWRWDGGTA